MNVAKMFNNYVKCSIPHTLCTFARFLSTRGVGVLGVPFEKGQIRLGVGSAPKALRDHGLIEQLLTIDGLDVKDFGDVEYEPEKDLDIVRNMQSLEHVAACTKTVSENVCNIITSGRRCLTIGGDHAVGVGTIDGHVRAVGPDIAVLWIDAHADLNTNTTSPSGNIHGMSLALLVRELSDYWPYLPGMDWQRPLLSIRNIAYIGLRSVDAYERLVIDKLGITAFGMEDVERLGVNAVVQLALEKVDPQGNRSIHVSYDIDSLDSLEAPSTGTSVRGGLTLREGICIMEAIHHTGRLTALDLVEVNPEIGDAKDVRHTVDAAINIIKAGFGYRRRGLIPKNIEHMPHENSNQK